MRIKVLAIVRLSLPMDELLVYSKVVSTGGLLRARKAQQTRYCGQGIVSMDELLGSKVVSTDGLLRAREAQRTVLRER